MIHARKQEVLHTISASGDAVQAFFQDYRFDEVVQDPDVVQQIRSCLSDIGLRLRPFLLRAGFEAGSDVFARILPLAAGVELIQISTLVVDDILDESPLRNNEPSVFARRGPKESLAIGAIMSSLGLSLIAKQFAQDAGLKNSHSVLNLLACTHARIYEGQILDMRFEGHTDISEVQYFDMIYKTTACFIQASLVVGAQLWNAPADIINALEDIGRAIGMAYQIRDDVIDVIGDSECTGKPVGGDIRRSKMRLPVIRALSKLQGEDRGSLKHLLSGKGLSDEAVRKAHALTQKTDSVDYCISVTKQYCEEARQFIKQLPNDLVVLRDQLDSIAKLISSFEE